jgi:DNA-binding XRE family transcriptional regulator
MCTCACGEDFASVNDLESHFLDVPDEDDRDHFEVIERRRAPVLVHGHVDPRIAWGIRRLRIERGWTQQRVALLLGCHHTRISRIESGERGTPSAEVVADLLATTVRYLLMPCPDCHGTPPRGYECLRCGAKNKKAS